MSGKCILLTGSPFPLSIEMLSSLDPGFKSFDTRTGSGWLIALVFTTSFKGSPTMVCVSTNHFVLSTTTMAMVETRNFKLRYS